MCVITMAPLVEVLPLDARKTPWAKKSHALHILDTNPKSGDLQCFAYKLSAILSLIVRLQKPTGFVFCNFQP